MVIPHNRKNAAIPKVWSNGLKNIHGRNINMRTEREYWAGFDSVRCASSCAQTAATSSSESNASARSVNSSWRVLGNAAACACEDRINNTSRKGTPILAEVSAVIFCNRSGAGRNKPSFRPSQIKPPRDQITDKPMTVPPIPQASPLNSSGIDTAAPMNTNQMRNRNRMPMTA